MLVCYVLLGLKAVLLGPDVLTRWLQPTVQDKATLQNRLETAINNAEGFGLR